MNISNEKKKHDMNESKNGVHRLSRCQKKCVRFVYQLGISFVFVSNLVTNSR